MAEIHILLFYKYIKLENPKKFVEDHKRLCDEIGLRGRILVAKEGINGSISGTEKQIEEYKSFMQKDTRFSDIMFKEDIGLMHPFKKMVVKVKEELVRFEQKVNLKNKGIYLNPREFIEFSKQEDVIILDARNYYESAVGKFKNAITPEIKTFKEFPKVLDLLKGKENKKIAMYCTGGIRCEKASAFLKENGFKNVYQLHGGILTFGKQYPDTIWEGNCFVFDKRMISKVNTGDSGITNCEICNVKCDLYKNCKRSECDKYCTICLECEKNFGGCCSIECFDKIQEPYCKLIS